MAQRADQRQGEPGQCGGARQSPYHDCAAAEQLAPRPCQRGEACQQADQQDDAEGHGQGDVGAATQARLRGGMVDALGEVEGFAHVFAEILHPIADLMARIGQLLADGAELRADRRIGARCA